MGQTPQSGLRAVPVTELLAQFAEVLGELYDRGIVRTRATPAADLAELLVARAFDGRTATGPGSGWHVWGADGRRLQVKCRVVQPAMRPSETYSPFRSWDFDACVFVLLDPATYDVRQAVELPVAAVEAISAPNEWTAGHRVQVGQDLLAAPGAVERTAELRAALRELDALPRPASDGQEVLPFEATELTVLAPHREVPPTGICLCGCGEPVAAGRHFAPSHDRKAEAAVVREHYGSIAAFVVAHRRPEPR